MNVSDSDLAMLELMLDGELPEEAAETLMASMQHDHALAAAWAQLKSERALRLAMWHENQPSQQAVNILASRIIRRNRFGGVWKNWGWAIRLGSAVAACVVLGFGLGWYGRGNKTPVGGTQAIVVPGSSSSEFQVQLTDAQGRPVAEQPFSSLQQAVEFANDVNQWKSAQRLRASTSDNASSGSTVVPVLDQY